MGKRELLLFVAFLAFGAVVYQVTAPPADPSKEGFSLSKFVGQVKAELKGENVETVINTTTSADAPSGEGRLLIPEYRGTLTILGEERKDISAELKAIVYGMDEDQAKVRAKDVAVSFEEKGEDLKAQVTLPSEFHRRPRLELTLRVPAHMGITMGLRSGQADLRRVGRVRFDYSRGKVTMAEVGDVEGEFENGNVEIVHAQTVTLKLQRTPARLEEIQGQLTLEAVHSDLRLQQLHGPAKLMLERLDCEIDSVHGPITIEPQHVNLSVRNVAAPLTVKGEHSEVLATLIAAVPVTIETTDDQIDLRPPKQGVTIDASTEGGQIRVADPTGGAERSDSDDEQVERPEKPERPEPPEPPEPPEAPGHVSRMRDSKHKNKDEKSKDVDKAEKIDRLHTRSEQRDDDDRESRTKRTVLKLHGGGPTITLRNARADIVIR